jgi:hypothetical protein
MASPDAIVSMLLDRDSGPVVQTSTAEALTCIRTFVFSKGIVNSEDEYRALLHEVTIRLAREEVSQSARGDEEIIHAIKMLDDLSPTLNLLSEHLFEWYSMYEEEVMPSEDAVREILMSHETPPAMRTLAQNLTDLYESRRTLIEYIQDEMLLRAACCTVDQHSRRAWETCQDACKPLADSWCEQGDVSASTRGSSAKARCDLPAPTYPCIPPPPARQDCTEIRIKTDDRCTDRLLQRRGAGGACRESDRQSP